jgi:hypothetical protein
VGEILRRRWYAVAATWLVTVVVVGVVFTQVRTSYVTTGTLIFLQPEGGAETGTSSLNPYTAFDASLGVTADTVATLLRSRRVAEELRRDGATGHFTVTRSSTSPTLQIRATGRSDVETIATVRLALRAASEELARRQQATGAPSSTWIRVDLLGLPEHAVRVSGRRLRAVAAVGLLGLALSVAAAYLLDGLATEWHEPPAPRLLPAPEPRGAPGLVR